MDVKSALDPMLREWARQYRRIWLGGVVYPDGQFTPDGWPTTTILGKLREERDGATQGRVSQHFDEVYHGDGLLVWRAMERMPIGPRSVIYCKYLCRDLVRTQADEIGISVATYWAMLDRAYYFLAGRLDALTAEPCAEMAFSGNRV